MEIIIIAIVIGLISKYLANLKENVDEKGSDPYGMPPFPKAKLKAKNQKVYHISGDKEKQKFPLDQKLYSVENNNQDRSKLSNEFSKVETLEDDLEDIFHLDNVKKGIIWQEILEEPRARRPYRRF